MIYVYWGYEIGAGKEPVKVVKIGYTDDLKERINAHRSSRPTLEVLFTIDGGTQEDEYSIQTYFKDYQFPCGSTEWFYYREEIISFFKEHSTIEEIMKIVPRVAAKEKCIPNRTSKFIASFIASDLNLGIDSYKYLERLIIKKKLRDLNSLKIFLEYCGYSEKSIDGAINELNKCQSTLSEDASNFIKECIDASVSWENLFRSFCELEESIRNEVIYYVPYKMKHSYDALGPERCKALGYNYFKISKAKDDVLKDPKVLMEAIYSNFECKRYLMAEIKNGISKIYRELGYNKTAKAVDIEEWFEIKEVVMPNPITGKRGHGFELLKKKQNSSGEA